MIFALLYWAYRHRDQLGGGDRHARDPVCGMQVETANAPAKVTDRGQLVYFCSDHCAQRFTAGAGTAAAELSRPRTRAGSGLSP